MRFWLFGVWVMLMSLFGIQASCQNKTSPAVEKIRLNQLGFYPFGPKIAIVTATNVSDFSILSADRKKILFKAKLESSVNAALNGKKTLIADFSDFNQPGTYVLNVKGLGDSFPFSITELIHTPLAKGVVKAFYYQRASIALPEKYAGKWHRTAGHPDDKVIIHSSATSANRPVGTLISASKGWYDAGDYNKYIVNSGITTGTMLSLCEDFPAYVNSLNLNIPESTNNIPDLLDEIIWNLRWMLNMQDPEDGGVYNKLTNAAFDGMVMPEVTKAPRYVVQKSTAATLDFAAVTAQASRILKKYQKDLPGLSDSCLAASVKAWNWAQKNPAIVYQQNVMNQNNKPAIVTGGYGDRSFADEFIWAASELYITTGNESYYKSVNMFPDERMPLPSWGNVRLLGYYTLARNEKVLTGVAKKDLDMLKGRIISMSDDLINNVQRQAYKTVMGKSQRDFGWGSNSGAANQGIALIQAYRLSGEKKYIDFALSNLDYLLGRNAAGYSYVTGFGSKTPMFPHHRPSAADRIKDPVPGLLVGGPNPGKQDGVELPSLVPDEAYVDDEKSYAANEIAINWNAPLVYLCNAIEALQHEIGYSKKKN
ncbi:MAG: glycoside hydrolase family 9 protein [Sphingobacteriaceae bacterium]|nr:glycoside hydrolase family 9 protein [Sphingobacteriaceae bacterium]